MLEGDLTTILAILAAATASCHEAALAAVKALASLNYEGHQVLRRVSAKLLPHSCHAAPQLSASSYFLFSFLTEAVKLDLMFPPKFLFTPSPSI